MTRYSLDCRTALIVFKITHQDRAGETGTVIRKQGEVVALDHGGQAIIAAEGGDIIQCPAGALHPVTPGMAGAFALAGEHDLIAAAELVRWFPADTVPFTLQWQSPGEITEMLETMRMAREAGG